MKYLFCTIFIIVLFLFNNTYIYAESSYVLPYPSAMPGTILHKVHNLGEKILPYWYFGNFSKFKYNLKEADKNLVEAKTLFEYKQYLLAYKALKKSDNYFEGIVHYLYKAQAEGKDINLNLVVLREAAGKHIEVLGRLKTELPSAFIWQDKKVDPIYLDIAKSLNKSILIRKKNYE